MRIKAFDNHVFAGTDRNGFMSEYSREDPMDLFWLLVMKPFYREANCFGNEVIWLVDQGIFFTVEIETTGKIAKFTTRYGVHYDYTEYVQFWINNPNPDDAMLFKLVWGDK